MKIFRLRPDVRYRVIDNEALVLRQDDAEILGLNEVGTKVLDLLESGRTVGQVVRALQQELDVDRRRLQTDVEGFLGELMASGVVEEHGHLDEDEAVTEDAAGDQPKVQAEPPTGESGPRKR